MTLPRLLCLQNLAGGCSNAALLEAVLQILQQDVIT